MNLSYLQEENLRFKFPVKFSPKIEEQINNISKYNKNNIEAISQWYDYIEGIKRYISSPVIAFDYTNRCIQLPNGTRFIQDFGYDIGYTINQINLQIIHMSIYLKLT